MWNALIRILQAVAILAVVSSFAHADGQQFVHFKKKAAGGAGGCTSQTYDVQNTGGTTQSNFYSTEQWGQSFTAGVTGSLYSVSFHRYTGGAGERTLTVRVGTSADLTSSYSQTTCTVPETTQYFECVYASGNRPSLTASTVYYIGMQTSADGGVPWAIVEGNATYANGQEYYEVGSSDWDFTGSGQVWDINFKTRMCD